MKRRDLERHLRAHDAQHLREGGNHSFWGFDAERSSAVPRHREIDFLPSRAQDLQGSGDPAAERVTLMPSPLDENPNCEEAHATFRLVGDELRADEVTRRLGN